MKKQQRMFPEKFEEEEPEAAAGFEDCEVADLRRDAENERGPVSPKTAGRRASIFAIMAQGGLIAEMLPKFKRFGGGIKDIQIALNGSKKSSFKPYITLQAK